MNRIVITGATLGLLLISPIHLHAQQVIRHEMTITLHPESHRVEVEDTIILPERTLSSQDRKIDFMLHGGLRPTSTIADVTWVKKKRHFPSQDGSVPVENYTLTLPVGKHAFVLKYGGEIYHPLEQSGKERGRGIRGTPGLVSSDGIYLPSAIYWYPQFNDEMVTFVLDVRIPEPWNVISQGKRTQHHHKDRWVHIQWDSPEPQDEIILIGGPFTEYSRTAGKFQALAFLRTPDETLANKYLDATLQYLEMYSRLIGPYPYQKFALVENFWETGYGMPSFTLLGPKVIRFPFILHSSYPHEILHNWWGNSVFVDYGTGNWSEGLTAYLADHLIKEQRGTAVDYRRATLQKYTDYVTEAKDFPLTEFRSRHSSVTEAVGYGKTLMFFHMLRQRLGDETFIQGLQEFYQNHQFQRATFSDLQRAFAKVSGKDLRTEFTQWISQPGAPALRVSSVSARVDGDGYRLTAVLEQKQPGKAYRLYIPIAVYMDGQETAYQTTVIMEGKRLDLALKLPARPLRLAIDPEFDIFRRLDRDELPPALTQSFGADEILLLLPAQSSREVRSGYRQLAESWPHTASGQLEIKWDNELEQFPADRAVWLFGWENQFLEKFISALTDYDISVIDNHVRIEKTKLSRDRHSVVLTARHPTNPDLTLTWVATDRVAAMPGLGRKLPHYAKYSFLGFEGDGPKNILKGQWPVMDSPLSVLVPQEDGHVIEKGVNSKLATRRALIYFTLGSMAEVPH